MHSLRLVMRSSRTRLGRAVQRSASSIAPVTGAASGFTGRDVRLLVVTRGLGTWRKTTTRQNNEINKHNNNDDEDKHRWKEQNREWNLSESTGKKNCLRALQGQQKNVEFVKESWRALQCMFDFLCKCACSLLYFVRNEQHIKEQSFQAFSYLLYRATGFWWGVSGRGFANIHAARKRWPEPILKRVQQTWA